MRTAHRCPLALFACVLLLSTAVAHAETVIAAAARDDFDAVAKLVRAGASVDQRGSHGDTALQWAAFYGRARAAELLIALGANVNERLDTGATPLDQAAARGQDAVVALLLAHGAKVNARTDSGLTPLHFAANDGHLQVIRRLLAAGAKRDAKDVFGLTPADMARRAGYLNIARFLRGEAAAKEVKRPTRPAVDTVLTPADVPAEVPSAPITTRPSAPAVVKLRTVPAAISTPGAGYRVQIAAVQSEQRARSYWQRASGRMPGLLGGLRPVIVRLYRPGRRTLYRVQGGPLGLDRARALCAELRQRGQACIVRRVPGG